MKSSVIKRSIVIKGHKTSVSLEDPFWQALKDMAAEMRTTVSALINRIDQERDSSNLSSAVRQHVIRHYYNLVTPKPITDRPTVTESRATLA